ncbi:hypothetical protein [Anaerotignum sp.]|uniref:hypothetical protein n=1 Tax=Anaerotignum sp. TaxID=2039241 RepID=UPI00289C0DD3|nr:hypothetical protein [Anaerotignum sp.]
MQNPNVKYLKMPNGYFCLFYRQGTILFLRTNSSTGWSTPQIIAERIGSTFSICQFGEICYVLYTTTGGILNIASSKDFVNWEHEPLIGMTINSNNPKFFIVPTENTLHIIYHLPTETKGIESLVYCAFRNGRWEAPTQIDRFIPFGRTIFLARRLSKEHIILYYRTARNTWCAREMLLTPYTLGSLTPLIQTLTNFVDVSIVNDMERIHILYITRNMFRTQVTYQYKQTTAVSTPRILWEDTNCDNAMAFLENGKLMLMWTANGRPLRCISENNGATFGVVEHYTGSFPSQCLKGELTNADALECNAMETYGDLSRNFNPFLLVNASESRQQIQSLPFEQEAQPLPEKQEKKSSPLYYTQEPQSRRFLQDTQQQGIPFVHETQLSQFTQDTPAHRTPFNQDAQPSRFTQEPHSQTISFGREAQPQPFVEVAQSQQRNPFEQEMQHSRFAQEPQSNSFVQEIQNNPFAQDSSLQKMQKKSTSTQNSQKQQMEELTALLAQRSDEITEVNARWKAQVSRLEAELETMRQENKNLKQAIHAAQAEKKRKAAVQSVHTAQTEEEFKKLQAAENISPQPHETPLSLDEEPASQWDTNTEIID